MLAEAMRVGLPDAIHAFAAPDDGDDNGTLSKAERGRAEGAILGGVRRSLAER